MLEIGPNLAQLLNEIVKDICGIFFLLGIIGIVAWGLTR